MRRSSARRITPVEVRRLRCLRTRAIGRSSAIREVRAPTRSPRASAPAIANRSGSASARKMSSGVSAMSVSLLTMRRCNSPTRSSARSTGSSARGSGPPSPPTSRNGSATASRRPSGSSNSASRCGWARSGSTSTRGARDSSRPPSAVSRRRSRTRPRAPTACCCTRRSRSRSARATAWIPTRSPRSRSAGCSSARSASPSTGASSRRPSRTTSSWRWCVASRCSRPRSPR